jgi:hypothetical protein
MHIHALDQNPYPIVDERRGAETGQRQRNVVGRGRPISTDKGCQLRLGRRLSDAGRANDNDRGRASWSIQLTHTVQLDSAHAGLGNGNNGVAASQSQGACFQAMSGRAGSRGCRCSGGQRREGAIWDGDAFSQSLQTLNEGHS